jgi:hypothetical protein
MHKTTRDIIMRKETQQIMTAFLKRTSCHRKNSSTDGEMVTLFGNKIAWREADGSISMWLCGHGTVTTRERLNGLCELMFGRRPWHQHKRKQMYDDKEIDLHQVVTVHTLQVMDGEEWLREAA